LTPGTGTTPPGAASATASYRQPLLHHNDTFITTTPRPLGRQLGGGGSSQNDVFGAPMMVTRQTGTGRALGGY